MKLFLYGQHYIRAWTSHWMTDDQKEVEIAKIRNEQSLQFTLFLEKLGDPLKKSRKAFGLQLDSCKRSIQSR